jgi:hypothetical protein
MKAIHIFNEPENSTQVRSKKKIEKTFFRKLRTPSGTNSAALINADLTFIKNRDLRAQPKK